MNLLEGYPETGAFTLHFLFEIGETLFTAVIKRENAAESRKAVVDRFSLSLTYARDRDELDRIFWRGRSSRRQEFEEMTAMHRGVAKDPAAAEADTIPPYQILPLREYPAIQGDYDAPGGFYELSRIIEQAVKREAASP